MSATSKIIWTIVVAGIAIAVTGSALLLMSSRNAAGIDGQWTARMQQDGQRPYTIRLRFVRSGNQLTGTVEHPNGTSAIEDGAMAGSRIRFTTRSDNTLNYTGEFHGRQIDLTATAPGGIVLRGAARKSD